MTRAVIYARFSTELQNEKSTDDQIVLCRAHAARQGLHIVGIYEDKARSGVSVFGRDGLMRLMDAAREHAFDVVWLRLSIVFRATWKIWRAFTSVCHFLE